MLGALGWLVQERFAPLFGGDIGGPALRHFQMVQERYSNFWLVILFSIAVRSRLSSPRPLASVAESPPAQLFEGVRISEAWNKPRCAAGHAGGARLGWAARER